MIDAPGEVDAVGPDGTHVYAGLLELSLDQGAQGVDGVFRGLQGKGNVIDDTGDGPREVGYGNDEAVPVHFDACEGASIGIESVQAGTASGSQLQLSGFYQEALVDHFRDDAGYLGNAGLKVVGQVVDGIAVVVGAQGQNGFLL